MYQKYNKSRPQIFLCMCSYDTGAADGAWLRVASESLDEILFSGASSVSAVCPVRTSSKQCTTCHRMQSKASINGNKPTLIKPRFNSQFVLVSEGILDEMAPLLYHNRSSPVIVTRCCEIMASLGSSSIGQQVQYIGLQSSLIPVFVCRSCLVHVCMIPKVGKGSKINLNPIIVV